MHRKPCNIHLRIFSAYSLTQYAIINTSNFSSVTFPRIDSSDVCNMITGLNYKCKKKKSEKKSNSVQFQIIGKMENKKNVAVVVGRGERCKKCKNVTSSITYNEWEVLSNQSSCSLLFFLSFNLFQPV